MKKKLLNEILSERKLNREHREDFLSQMNQYDYLTGLPSMTFYFVLEDLGRKKNLENGKHSAIVYFNFRGMKDYNRKFGYSEGDQLILDLSQLIVKYFGKECCGRFGSDHFSAFAAADEVEDKLNALMKEVRNLNDGKSLPLVAGIYLDEIENVNASLACDRAKMACDELNHSAECDFRYFDMKMLEKEIRRQYILDNLDRAIKERWIQVFYQPIIRVVGGQVCEEESLARWIDPEKGMIYPNEFIPVLEESGLIHKLDLCIIDQVLEKMQLFEENGMVVVPASINISRNDFDACDIVEEIRKRVDNAGIDRSRLNIEITESVIGSDFDYIKEQIERFRNLGFKVWMDDFGSGYSSLDVLQNIDFDLIKLDMRFIQQFDNSRKSRVLLTEIMKMVIGMGAEALCEGVETKEQVEFLQEIGCMKIQGYYFCKPIPLDEIFKRYEMGAEIGMENPREAEYFSVISKFNLNDTSVISSSDPNVLSHYMDTIPAVVLEVGKDEVVLVRSNSSGKEFMKHFLRPGRNLENLRLPADERPVFVEAVRKCREDGNWTKIDDVLEDGTTVQSYLRVLGVNPVNKARAVAVIVLALVSD
ncbi:MAG: GGDEF domain-containing protein [Parasporobacterium sp.]|nr:GGDEF domain-containing protein [Parasporobacterium sp.]